MNEAAKAPRLRLGVNIDHVATIRNARGGTHPDPVRAAQIVAAVGGDGITAHLREDRRHIRDADIERIMAATNLPLNLEMAATDEMMEIALRYKPHAACIVPEKRAELTTEGGLDLLRPSSFLPSAIARLRGKLKYRPVVFELMAPTFTLLELQRAVEALALYPFAYTVSGEPVTSRGELCRDCTLLFFKAPVAAGAFMATVA